MDKDSYFLLTLKVYLRNLTSLRPLFGVGLSEDHMFPSCYRKPQGIKKNKFEIKINDTFLFYFFCN